MHEAGYKVCVGIFGSSINEDQLLLLEQSGALNVIILTDSDEAGNKACSQIIKKCGRRFNYYRPNISTKDVGDMSIDQIKEELHPQLEGLFDDK
jgi:DNA primase